MADQKEFPCTPEHYEFLNEIGTGAFSTVYKASLVVAVKVINLDEINTNWEEIRKEILISKLLHQANVIPVHTAFSVLEELWIVMEFMSAGSCSHVLKQLYPKGIKDETVIATILLGVLNALEYIHKDGHIHRDIKAGNILLSKDGAVKLCDFGVTGALIENGNRKTKRKTFVGTPCWMAPEVMENVKGYDMKADIWSVGITALELAFGSAPYAKFQPMKVLLLTLQEDPPTAQIFKDNSYAFSSQFHEMVEKCLQKNPERRPTVAKLKALKFFKKANEGAALVEMLKLLPELGADKPFNAVKYAEHKQLQRKPVSIEHFDFDTLDDLKAMVKSDEMKKQGRFLVSQDPIEVHPPKKLVGNEMRASLKLSPTEEQPQPATHPKLEQTDSSSSLAIREEQFGRFRVQSQGSEQPPP